MTEENTEEAIAKRGLSLTKYYSYFQRYGFENRTARSKYG